MKRQRIIIFLSLSHHLYLFPGLLILPSLPILLLRLLSSHYPRKVKTRSPKRMLSKNPPLPYLRPHPQRQQQQIQSLLIPLRVQLLPIEVVLKLSLFQFLLYIPMAKTIIIRKKRKSNSHVYAKPNCVNTGIKDSAV